MTLLFSELFKVFTDICSWLLPTMTALPLEEGHHWHNSIVQRSYSHQWNYYLVAKKQGRC
jgi:hypothetical protein